MESMKAVDVAVIGAGPAGAVAAALARRRGLSVRILEKTRFPRFQIGESLLPQCMCVLDEAGMVEAVKNAGFQYKDGAQIVRGERRKDFVFGAKFTPGYNYAYEVTRADFDLLLARESEKQGAELHFEHEILGVEFPSSGGVYLRSRDAQGSEYGHEARFVLDASGYGRVLPRLLGLDKPSTFPVRAAVFAHVEDRIDDPAFDRDKIRVAIHPDHLDVWYWLIPFSNGRASIGVVAPDRFLKLDGADADLRLWSMIREEPGMARMLRNARPLWPARAIRGFSSAVTRTCGERYALLGNAAEFLDPVFSSGVTLALNSAKLAVDAMARELAGGPVDWEQDFVAEMKLGVGTCRGLVETWYEGGLQEILLSEEQPERIYRLLCGVLGGYAWDRDNPYVGHSGRRLRALAQIIRNQRAGRASGGIAAAAD